MRLFLRLFSSRLLLTASIASVHSVAIVIVLAATLIATALHVLATILLLAVPVPLVV